MRAYLQLAALSVVLVFAASTEAHVGGFGGVRGGVGGGYRSGFSPSFSAPHYAAPISRPTYNFNRGSIGYAPTNRVNNFGPSGRVDARVNNFGPSGRVDANVNNRFGPTTIGSGNFSNDFNRTNINNTRIGNNTNIGNNSYNRIGNTTTNFNRNTNINGNRDFVNTGNIIGRETNITNVNRSYDPIQIGGSSVNVNRNGWAGWNGYHSGWNAGYATAAWNRPGAWGWNRPWGSWYGWYRGGWRGWNYWPTIWGGAFLDPIVYSNPYYVPVLVPVPVGGDDGGSAVVAPPPVVIQQSSTYEVPPAIDYSRPIPVPTQADVDSTDTSVVQTAQEHLDAGRAAFKKGNYRAALLEADKAIEALPSDANSHEFRALCLFAQKRYTDAAATIYAVLNNGPGWDMNTMTSFYADPNTYKKQVADLEAFVKANPKDSAAHFLLAYEYLVQDQRGLALAQLKLVEKLQPNDQLAKSIADALAKDQGKS